MPKVFVGIGSNVERDLHVPAALRDLTAQFGPLRISSIYESQAEGFVGDPFYNLVAGFETSLPIREIALRLDQLEKAHGRTADCRKFAPRPLDLDLLLYDDVCLQEGRIRVPRDDILRFAFVLEPLAEIAPQEVHPQLRQSYGELWNAFDRNQVRQQRVQPDWAAVPGV